MTRPGAGRKQLRVRPVNTSLHDNIHTESKKYNKAIQIKAKINGILLSTQSIDHEISAVSEAKINFIDYKLCVDITTAIDNP